jgi:heat shock protein HspQ
VKDGLPAQALPEFGRIARMVYALVMTREAMKSLEAKYRIGQVVRHRLYPFRGVIYDVDPTFNNTEEWWLSIPEAMRPSKDQPFYHLLAENAETEYSAYVSEQNLLPDDSGEPLRHPELEEKFEVDGEGNYRARGRAN